MADIRIEFSSSALPALDALSTADQKRVLAATKALSAGIHRALLQVRMGSQDAGSLLYMLRAGSDIRLLVERREDEWRVLDIIRKSAMERISGREVR